MTSFPFPGARDRRTSEDPYEAWSDPAETGPPWSGGVDEDRPWLGRDRLSHLVLLDGRLVDGWTEGVSGTRWEHLVPASVRPVVHLAPDPHEETLGWLTGLCGSEAGLDALTSDPLEDVGGLEPELAGLLDRLRVACFDDESVVAMRRASRLLDGLGPIRGVDTPAQSAAGVAWCVAKANGLFGPGGTTQVAVQHTLGLASGLATYGRSAERGLVGHLTWGQRGPRGAPELLALGRPDLLVARTRSTLIAWRDRAREGRRRAAALHPCTTCSATG